MTQLYDNNLQLSQFKTCYDDRLPITIVFALQMILYQYHIVVNIVHVGILALFIPFCSLTKCQVSFYDLITIYIIFLFIYLPWTNFRLVHVTSNHNLTYTNLVMARIGTRREMVLGFPGSLMSILIILLYVLFSF